MDASAGEIVLPKLLGDLRAQLDGLVVPRHRASVDSSTEPLKRCRVLPVLVSYPQTPP